ncbi:KpsF/GutQ [Pararhodospirillum photometricum DSM 122]|uniref:KpsF/GutQ n=1 Tax=Pararhodospirillum photometricum DSM 122 TaxID=1150469 RepID=H6SR90_PARPM|nr:KpsF/GutQ [Pararhodospirillum photometricum DSM 122]
MPCWPASIEPIWRGAVFSFCRRAPCLIFPAGMSRICSVIEAGRQGMRGLGRPRRPSLSLSADQGRRLTRGAGPPILRPLPSLVPFASPDPRLASRGVAPGNRVPVMTSHAFLSCPPPSSDPALDAARRVLETEAQTLGDLARGLDASFSGAVALLGQASGKVIVTGMGKSGHVGRKIAATLASTGTPSFFVHPGEASHGDLGMIGPQDAVIALSNSGETAELADLVAYTRRAGIALVSMTGRHPSTLSSAADVALVLPPLTEACPHGLAPTSSTTAMMALGDALAVALLEQRGFTASDFRVFHPGGGWGACCCALAT